MYLLEFCKNKNNARWHFNSFIPEKEDFEKQLYTNDWFPVCLIPDALAHSEEFHDEFLAALEDKPYEYACRCVLCYVMSWMVKHESIMKETWDSLKKI